MILVRTPFRISLGGGGTDLPSYYGRYGGFVVSATLNKYMFISVNRPVIDDLIRLKYSQSETVASLDEIKHDIAREALRLMGIEQGVEITSFADVPAGTGLGSSSCYTVGLVHALATLKRQDVIRRDLAETAITIEMDILKKPVGKQDQYMAAYGGCTALTIDTHGRVDVRHLTLDVNDREELRRNLLIFYTSVSRSADTILHEQEAAIQQDNETVVASMHKIKEIGYKTLEALETRNFDTIGHLFDQHWEFKKQISQKISNPRFDEIYRRAKDAGALGGKIVGAGGGGFFLFYVPQHHGLVRSAMKEFGLREMQYQFDDEGTKVIANF